MKRVNSAWEDYSESRWFDEDKFRDIPSKKSEEDLISDYIDDYFSDPVVHASEIKSYLSEDLKSGKSIKEIVEEYFDDFVEDSLEFNNESKDIVRKAIEESNIVNDVIEILENKTITNSTRRNNMRKPIKSAQFGNFDDLKSFGSYFEAHYRPMLEDLAYNGVKLTDRYKRLLGFLLDDLNKVVGGEINSSRKNSKGRKITSANNYGWVVDSSEADKALDMWVEYVGEENALEDIARALSTDDLDDNIDWIAQQWGFGEDIENIEDSWDKYEYAKEIMGAEELLNNLTQAIGTDELAEDLAFIFRMNDFREWKSDFED